MLGPVPDEPLDRLEWQERAAKVASYREMYGYEDPGEPIGPEPVNSPEARAAWHAAFAALGPVDGVDLRTEPDGRLLNLRASYEAANRVGAPVRRRRAPAGPPRRRRHGP